MPEQDASDTYTIKPLEWTDDGNGEWRSRTLIGVYVVIAPREGMGAYWFTQDVERDVPDVAAGKAAAEEHHRARVTQLLARVGGGEGRE